MPCLFLWMWGTYVRCFLLQRPSFPGLLFMLCVLFLRSRGLPDAWGDVCCPICLTRWVTHDPSTAVRATTSLRGERAHLTMLILSPPNGFLSRSLFHNPPHSCGEQMFSDGSHDFSRQISFLCVLCSIMGMCSFTSSPIRGWGRRKAGDWGRKPGRGRGIAAGLPPFPWVVSPRFR